MTKNLFVFSFDIVKWYLFPAVQVIPICKDRTMTHRTPVYIDTVEVPKVKNISCTCIISNTVKTEKLIFKIQNITTKHKMKFEIMGNVLDRSSSSSDLHIKNRSELTFTSYGNLEKDGACLTIYNTARTYLIFKRCISYLYCTFILNFR